jgi:hypothetical protein
MALIIYPMLVAYRADVADKGVVPSDFFQSVDVTGKTEEEAKAIHEKMYNEALEKWLSVLDKMIWAYNEIRHDYEGEEKFFSVDDGKDVTDLENRYDLDKNGLNDYYERIDEGLHLFARHYRSLWW